MAKGTWVQPVGRGCRVARRLGDEPGRKVNEVVEGRDKGQGCEPGGGQELEAGVGAQSRARSQGRCSCGPHSSGACSETGNPHRGLQRVNAQRLQTRAKERQAAPEFREKAS